MSRQEFLVGFDDSPSARSALRWAAAEAGRAHAPLRAVHVLSWPFGTYSAGIEAELTQEELHDLYRASISRAFDSLGPGPDCVLQFARGDAGPVLVRQSWDAAALVVGMPEHVGLGRLLAGSVAQYCLAHARCPVVAVPQTVSTAISSTTGRSSESEAMA